jgi:hypothetical protein
LLMLMDLTWCCGWLRWATRVFARIVSVVVALEWCAVRCWCCCIIKSGRIMMYLIDRVVALIKKKIVKLWWNQQFVSTFWIRIFFYSQISVPKGFIPQDRKQKDRIQKTECRLIKGKKDRKSFCRKSIWSKPIWSNDIWSKTIWSN